MKLNVQVLLSIMNIKNGEEYMDLLNKNAINSNVLAINQIDNNITEFNIENEIQKMYTYKEKGASNSRNRLLENATGDICIFADNDTVLATNYEEIIRKEYEKNKKADVIIFYAENENKNREKNKKIGNKKINIFDSMKVRTNEITLKKETIQKLKDMNIKFDKNFGPGSIFDKGEETVFIADLLKYGFKIYSVNIQIATSKNETSTWFSGFNEKFLYDQGAIFYRIAPRIYKLLILQYIVRKHHLYKDNVSINNAYKNMIKGAKHCKKIKLER